MAFLPQPYDITLGTTTVLLILAVLFYLLGMWIVDEISDTRGERLKRRTARHACATHKRYWIRPSVDPKSEWPSKRID